MIEFKHGAGRRLQEQHLKDALSEVKLLRARIAELEAALRDITARLLETFPGLKDLPPIQKARAALGEKE